MLRRARDDRRFGLRSDRDRRHARAAMAALQCVARSAMGFVMSHRLRNFLLMLPFFVIGIAIPVYYFGWSGDQGVASSPSYDSSPSPSSNYAPRMQPSREVVDASR